MEYGENGSKASMDVLDMFSTTLDSLENKTRKANFEGGLRGLNKKCTHSWHERKSTTKVVLMCMGAGSSKANIARLWLNSNK